MTCPSCGAGFAACIGLTRLRWNDEPAIRRQYLCPDCGHRFTSLELLTEQVDSLCAEAHRYGIITTAAAFRASLLRILA